MFLTISALYSVIGVTLSVIDIRYRLLPDKILLPAIFLLHFTILIFATATQQMQIFLDALLGTVLMFAVFLLLALIARNQLGGGDVKFAAFVGPFVGYIGSVEAVILTLMITFILGGIVSVIMIFLKNAKHRHIPFGPVMFVSGWLGALATIEW